MQYNIIQKKSKQELFDLINELKAELFLLRFKNKTGQQDQTHKIRLVRRDIAKALTALKSLENSHSLIEEKPLKGLKKSTSTTIEKKTKKVSKTKDKEVK